MKRYVRVAFEERATYGMVEGDEILLLEGDTPETFVKTQKRIPYDKAKLLVPCVPQKIICSGLNYKDTVLEDGATFPKKPLLFLKPPSAIVSTGEDIVQTDMVGILTIEAELAVVIGKRCKNIAPCQGMDYVWGYLAANDVTAKDLQKEDTQWTRAKSFDTFLPLSSEIVAEIDPSALPVLSYINTHTSQKGSVADMLFDIPTLISYTSQVMTLLPGDIILTGTPKGYGKVVEDGDVVTIEIPNIGVVTNRVKKFKY